MFKKTVLVNYNKIYINLKMNIIVYFRDCTYFKNYVKIYNDVFNYLKCLHCRIQAIAKIIQTNTLLRFTILHR